MSYVHPYSKRCEKSEIDLFSIPPTQLSLEKGRWIEYHPVSDVKSGDRAITYLVPGTDEYIDLSKTILCVEGKVIAGTGNDLSTGQANVAPVNNFLHSLFKQVDVYLNGKQVTPAMGTYAYRSYIETLLNYDVSAKKSQLSSALYYKDTPGHMDDKGGLPHRKEIKVTYKDNSTGTERIEIAGTGNQGFAKRSEFIQDSKKFSLSGPIFSDVFMSDRLLLNGMTLKIVLNRSSDEFCLMDKNDPGSEVKPKVTLSNVVLKIRKVKVDQAVSDALGLLLLKSPAIYPIRRVECKFLTIPGGLPSTRKDNIFSGLIPKSFIFGLVDADAFTGKTGKNPYNFKHFQVNNIGLTVNGEEIPFKQLTLTYPTENNDNTDKVDFIQAYNTLFSGTGKMYANMGLDISREDYANGNTLYAFDLTPDMCNTTNYFNAVQHGSLSVDISFATNPNDPIAMVCYGDFENVMRIDSQRNVIYDIS